MEERIGDKINEIEKYIEELLAITPESFEEYEKDFKINAACERYFEKIIEAAVDLAFLFVRHKQYDSPSDDKAVFEILAKKEIIPQELAERLKEAKSMRNFIAHEYGKVDDSKVFQAIKEELEDDINKFIKSIEKAR